MVVIGVEDGIVKVCVSVNSFDDVRDYYPECTLTEQVGEENIGWTFDGVTFSPPQG